MTIASTLVAAVFLQARAPGVPVAGTTAPTLRETAVAGPAPATLRPA
ncbi:MAG TPA: hypothetical protein VLA66_05835 [Thermoanaerobaculia bacterium]|nr:hypothetical protein [Thermoanaerobaculia bacterium]